MATDEEKDKQKTVSDFRFGIIADLVYSHASGRELARLIAEKAARTYTIPFSHKTKITQSCIRKWLSVYRAKGRGCLSRRRVRTRGSAALLPMQRKS